jgi:hypothetical protein
MWQDTNVSEGHAAAIFRVNLSYHISMTRFHENKKIRPKIEKSQSSP